jgi:hypothetical protein
MSLAWHASLHRKARGLHAVLEVEHSITDMEGTDARDKQASSQPTNPHLIIIIIIII